MHRAADDAGLVNLRVAGAALLVLNETQVEILGGNAAALRVFRRAFAGKRDATAPLPLQILRFECWRKASRDH